jgi:hypothetical protein
LGHPNGAFHVDSSTTNSCRENPNSSSPRFLLSL